MLLTWRKATDKSVTSLISVLQDVEADEEMVSDRRRLLGKRVFQEWAVM
jgi:hypothetical protein